VPDISQDELSEYKWLFEEKFNENHFLLIGINSETNNNQIKKIF